MAGHEAIIRYWAKVEAQAEKYGVVRTFCGRPRRLTSQFRNARIREACNHPVQGGVSDIYTETALMVKRAAPWARLVYGSHDAQTWQVVADRADEFRAVAEPIVHRPIRVNGIDMVFPAEFKPVKGAA
jgi:DNA polymerase I-like protein with 3'-5' exonuclease and polymerase domains